MRERNTIADVSYHSKTILARQMMAPKHSRLKNLNMFIPFYTLGNTLFIWFRLIVPKESKTLWLVYHCKRF